MIIRFWGQNSRLESVAYQGEASETDLDSDSDGGGHSSHEFLHHHNQGAKTSRQTTMTLTRRVCNQHFQLTEIWR
jgi:hypothetical protein